MSPAIGGARSSRDSFMPDDSYVRPDAADISTAPAPFSYTTLLAAPDNVTAAIASNAARITDTAGHGSANRADATDMASADHTVYARIGTATWSATNDCIGVIGRAGGAGDRTAFAFAVFRLAGPLYRPLIWRFGAGAVPGQTNGTNLGSAPIAGDVLSINVSGSTITGAISTGGGAFTTVVTRSDATFADGKKGGIFFQQGGAGTDLRINGLWLNRAPF